MRPEQNAASDPLIGQTLRDYEIVGKLGEGGTTAVYKAQHLRQRRRVALKVLSPDASPASQEDFTRFMREAHAAAALNHPNIATVYGVWKAGAFYCIEMELVEGVPVVELLSHRAWLEVEEATQIVREAARALAAAHAQGIVHRDVKPANIMRTRRGNVKVTDFGLAKRVSAEGDAAHTALLGTPCYMSPEQCLGQPPDGRSDIYSLGATYFHMLTGEPPFKGDSDAETMLKHRTDPVPDPRERRPDIGDAVCAIIRKTMAKEPSQRYQACDELIADLERALREPTWEGPALGPGPEPMMEAGAAAAEEAPQPEPGPAPPDTEADAEVGESKEGPREPFVRSVVQGLIRGLKREHGPGVGNRLPFARVLARGHMLARKAERRLRSELGRGASLRLRSVLGIASGLRSALGAAARVERALSRAAERALRLALGIARGLARERADALAFAAALAAVLALGLALAIVLGTALVLGMLFALLIVLGIVSVSRP